MCFKALWRLIKTIYFGSDGEKRFSERKKKEIIFSIVRFGCWEEGKQDLLSE